MRANVFSAGLQYYTAGHLAMFLFAPIIFFVLYFTLRNRSEKTAYKTLMTVYLFNAILFTSYKIFMGFTYDTFVLLNELPLHLCNFNVILLPLALKTKNKFLFSYLYYVGTLGAFSAILFFDTTFLGKSITDYGVFVYFFYHSILLVGGVLVPVLKIYTPSLFDILKALGTLFMLVMIMHGINTILRISGACTIANYFYTYGMEGNPLLGMLMEKIPFPVLYMIPILPVVAVVNALMYLPFISSHRALVATNQPVTK